MTTGLRKNPDTGIIRDNGTDGNYRMATVASLSLFLSFSRALIMRGQEHA